MKGQVVPGAGHPERFGDEPPDGLVERLAGHLGNDLAEGDEAQVGVGGVGCTGGALSTVAARSRSSSSLLPHHS